VTPRSPATLGVSPTGYNRRKGEAQHFLNPRACIEAELRNFPSPRAQEEARASNFLKSQSETQGPYRYGGAKSNILTYFFIFLTCSFIFSTYSYIFLIYSFIYSTYSFIFPSYLLHQGISECDVIKGGVA